MNQIIFILLFFGLIILIAKLMPLLDLELQRYYFQNIHWRNHINRKYFLKIDGYLEQHNAFYAGLSQQGRGKFVNRLLYYLKTWEFEGRQDLEVSIEMKLLITSSAAQLTYGHAHFEIPFIQRIAIYPSSFFSKLLNAEVNGVVYPQEFGLVALSWERVQDGFKDSRDTFNLALHEMAHALILNEKKGKGSDNAVELFSQRFIEGGFNHYLKLFKSGRAPMRDYAATNSMEFFALSIEYFFEDPADMRHRIPEIFQGLCILLNQNPLNRSKDYKLNPGFAQKAAERWPKLFFKGTQHMEVRRTAGRSKLLSVMLIPGFIVFFIDMSFYEGSPTVIWFCLAGAFIFTIILEWPKIKMRRVDPFQWVWIFLQGMAIGSLLIFFMSWSGLLF